jgi:hypothetical protein
LLVVLTRFFYFHEEPDARNLRLLRRWLWRAIVVGVEHAQGSSAVVLRRYLGCVGPGNVSRSVRALLSSVDFPERFESAVGPFNPRNASTRMLICAWWFNKPLDLINAREITQPELGYCLADSKSAKPVLPTIFRKDKESSSLSANHLIWPGHGGSVEEIDALIERSPVGVDSNQWSETLSSHLIYPEMVDLLTAGRVEGFLDRREAAIRTQFNHFLDLMCEWQLEDTPSLSDLVIEDENDEGRF